MTVNTKIEGPRELSLDELDAVSGGNGEWEWDNNLRDWGADTVTAGLGATGTGVAIAVVDTPLPGPADVAAAPLIFGGVVTTTAGGVAYAAGSVGGLIDWVTGLFGSGGGDAKTAPTDQPETSKK